jgi:aspartate aminotransferase
MSTTTADLHEFVRGGAGGGLSRLAETFTGSEILRVAAEIRAARTAGRPVTDLTVGDFSPAQFPIPERLREEVREALGRGETNYPPPPGMPELRQAVQRFYARELGLHYPVEAIEIACGSRPLIYGTYRMLCDPGDRVVYPVPSWNNNHYSRLVGAVATPVRCGEADRFLPTRAALAPALPGARLLVLNSPLNPTGTAFSRDALAGVVDAVLSENDGRARRGERPLFLLYDQVYWMLCFGDTRHVTPVEIAPEMARYTVFVDGISKCLAATGLRVGWAAGPVHLVERMTPFLAHVGAWAPRPEQVATARLLDAPAAIAGHLATFKRELAGRLERLHAGLQAMKAAGLPVDSIPPMGAIYLTMRLHPFGARTPAGAALATNEDVRRFLLEAADVGVVPFQAFGAPEDDGCFRLSVGAVSLAEIDAALERLRAALGTLAR